MALCSVVCVPLPSFATIKSNDIDCASIVMMPMMDMMIVRIVFLIDIVFIS